MNKVIFISGELCSGKSTIAKRLAEELGYSFLEVSDVVKEILAEIEREKLQGHPEIAPQIVNAIETAVTWQNVIVSGVRQAEILAAFPDAECVWVEIPEEERLKRYLSRGDTKDKLTKEDFAKAQERDITLGILEVKEYSQKHGSESITKLLNDKYN